MSLYDDDKPHLLWIGDVGGVTGFSRVTEQVCSRLLDTFRITVIGLNARESHPYDYPWRVIPAQLLGDRFGVLRFAQMQQTDPPDITCILMDPRFIPLFLRRNSARRPLVAYMPIDSENVQDAKELSALDYAVFMSEFGYEEAVRSGFRGRATVVLHGVDLEVYHPQEPTHAREQLGLPLAAFLVGNVNRNQPRKRFDLTLLAYARWLVEYQIPDNVFLYCHCNPLDMPGWNLSQLVEFYAARLKFPALVDRVLFPKDLLTPFDGLPETLMPCVYSALDVQLTTTSGEGFGLTTLEGMACGVPQLIPSFAALESWVPAGAAYHMPVSVELVTTDQTNCVAAVPHVEDIMIGLQIMYRHQWYRERLRKEGLQLVRQPQYRWETIAGQLRQVLVEMLVPA